MGKKAKVTYSPAFKIGEISRRIYGAFLEPIGTMVNGDMYNPGHPTADEQGFRRDWIDALKAVGVPAVRLPGGNFMSGWDWKDSIGPKDQRKEHLDLAWHQYYSNEVGHDEYLQWAEKIGTEAMYTINLGTGNINDAVYNIEYTNHEGGTYWSNLRKKYGRETPYGVKVWYLGNEMDGPWQVGSWERNPEGYGVLANEVSKAMKWVDGTVETAVCVSSSPDLLHYPDWDLKVLRECYDSVDYISMHHYQSAEPGNYAQFMAASRYFRDYIRTEIGLCDYVQTLCRSPKVMMLSLDEYGVFPARNMAPLSHGREAYLEHDNHYPKHNDTPFVRHDPSNMGDAFTRFKDASPMLSALGGAGVLLEVLRHADRIKIACMTSGLMVAASCDAETVFKTTPYYTYTDLMKYGQGISLTPSVECDTYDLPDFAPDDAHKYHGQKDVELIDTAAALNGDELSVFVINRDWEDTAELTLDVSGFAGFKYAGHRELYSDDMTAQVEPVENTETAVENGILKAELKKLSWNVFRFVKA